MEKEQFLELLEKCKKVHGLCYCVKDQIAIPIEDCETRKCWECKDFVMNKGICDPL